jgi:hypothetical protein
VASLTEPHCTCPAYWQGRGKRPECPLHEAEGHPADTLEPGQARPGRTVTVMATIAPRAGPERDAEGMGAARSWRTVP